MNIQPTVELHPHQEFHFAENTDSVGCCCFWKSKTVKPKEYKVKKNGDLKALRLSSKINQERIVANARLSSLVTSKFENDPIDSDYAFEQLRQKVNHDFYQEPITIEALQHIVNAIYEIREEHKEKSESKITPEMEKQGWVV